MLKKFALALLLTGLAAAPALAVDIPPGGFPIVIDDGTATGSPATIGQGHRIHHTVAGKVVFLPPGPCKLKNGTVLTIGPDDKVANLESISANTLGGNASGGNAKPVGGAKISH